MIKIDESDGEKHDLRAALGIEKELKPALFFIDRTGTMHTNATVRGWAGKDQPEPKKAAGAAIHKRLDLILGDAGS